MRIRLRRVDRHGILEAPDGFGELTALLVNQAELVLRLTVVGVDSSCLQIPAKALPTSQSRSQVAEFAAKVVEDIEKEKRRSQPAQQITQRTPDKIQGNQRNPRQAHNGDGSPVAGSEYRAHGEENQHREVEIRDSSRDREKLRQEPYNQQQRKIGRRPRGCGARQQRSVIALERASETSRHAAGEPGDSQNPRNICHREDKQRKVERQANDRASQQERHCEHGNARKDKAALIQNVAHRQGGLQVEAQYQLRVGDQHRSIATRGDILRLINMGTRTLVIGAWIASAAFFPPCAPAEVTRVEIATTTPWLGGRALGKAGSYEMLQGRVYFELDPRSSTGGRVTDITLAPRNAAGKVEFSSDFILV